MALIHPLASRYSSNHMKYIFGKERKFSGWRYCWIVLAEAEMELGVKEVKPEHLVALKEFRSDIPYERANALEKELRHDVNAHILAYKEQVERICPGAGGIIHLGATSMFPCDNTELLQMRDGLDYVKGKTVNVLRRMAGFAYAHKNTKCLAKTHYQDAQPTTYGKRICDWMTPFVMALERVEYERNALKARGVKGTTGTQDSFLKLFDGDSKKIRKLDKIVAKKLGFEETYTITTQTYPRIVDYLMLSSLGAVAVAAKRLGGDLRLCQGAGELSEPFRKSQVGSSAMAYKRNPMRAERMCGLSRHVFMAPLEAAMYASEQWLERTLDDSAERRIVIADTFLGTDAVLNLALDIFSPDTEEQNGFRIYSEVAMNNLMKAMPFIVTEKVIIDAVKKGEDRQKVHEDVRLASLEARKSIDSGEENTMLEEMAKFPSLGVNPAEKDKLLNPDDYLGTAPEQCEMFLEGTIETILEENKNIPHMDGGVKV